MQCIKPYGIHDTHAEAEEVGGPEWPANNVRREGVPFVVRALEYADDEVVIDEHLEVGIEGRSEGDAEEQEEHNPHEHAYPAVLAVRGLAKPVVEDGGKARSGDLEWQPGEGGERPDVVTDKVGVALATVGEGPDDDVVVEEGGQEVADHDGDLDAGEEQPELGQVVLEAAQVGALEDAVVHEVDEGDPLDVAAYLVEVGKGRQGAADPDAPDGPGDDLGANASGEGVDILEEVVVAEDGVGGDDDEGEQLVHADERAVGRLGEDHGAAGVLAGVPYEVEDGALDED